MLWPRWGCSGGWAGHGQALRAVELMQLSRGRPISDRSSHHKLGEGKENSELRPGRVQASSLGGWRLALHMGSHALYVNTVAFQLLQKLSSRMSHCMWVDPTLHFLWTKAQNSWEIVSGDVISITQVLRDWVKGESKICEASYDKKQTKQICCLWCCTLGLWKCWFLDICRSQWHGNVTGFFASAFNAAYDVTGVEGCPIPTTCTSG